MEIIPQMQIKDKIMSNLKDKKLFLLDMDGTIYLDDDLDRKSVV